MEHHGLVWSEALCFGLGQGLGIWYMDFPNTSPSRIVHTRSADLEARFFDSIGCPFDWEQSDDPVKAEIALRAVLDAGRPAIVQTDIFYLPYFNSGTHFPGHVVLVWGYDTLKRVFLVTDTERKDVLEVPFDKMRLARHCKGVFFEIKGNLFAPEKIRHPENLPIIIEKAIVENSRTILQSADERCGRNALDKWQKEITGWKNLEDWKWAARFVYQTIEKRGTGGAGFRLMYTDFLVEAEKCIPRAASLGLSGLMGQAAHAWQRTAAALKTVSEQSSPDFKDCSHEITSLYRAESEYHRTAVHL